MGKTSHFSGRARATLGAFITLVLLLAVPQIASAHARMLRSSPPDGATVNITPDKIELWFNELLENKFNSVQVFLASDFNAKTRTNLVLGNPKVDPKDRTHITIDVKTLAPGEYFVEWRVLSLDGHSAPGRFAFHVAATK